MYLILPAVMPFQGGTPPVATLKFASPSAKPGATVDATLTVSFGAGLHGYQNPPSDEYQIPVKVSIVEAGFKLIKASYPKGVDFMPVGETKPTKVYQGKITIPLKIKAGTKPASYSVNVKLDYQECNDSACFQPASLIVKGTLVVKK